MHKACRFAAVLALVFLLLPLPGRAQVTPNKIKLLTQDTGWALFHSHLYWTTDFGKHWSDITPPGHGSITDAFFLDTFNGWALVGAPDAGGPDGGVGIVLATTSDSGNSWTISRVELPGWDLRQTTPGGRGTLDFIDATHGWLDLSVQSSAVFNRGALFATSDGGKTWRSVPAPVGYGSVKFISTQVGWVAGGPANSNLVVTRDGGKTWRHVRLAPPPGLPGNSMPSFQVPQFVESHRGFLAVSFNGWAVATYATADGGETWRPVVTLKGPPGSVGASSPVAIADSTLLVPARGRSGSLRLPRFSLRGPADPVPVPLPSRPARLMAAPSFIDASRGWVFTGWIYATTDGGATWTDVTPRPKAHPRPRSAGVPAGVFPSPRLPPPLLDNQRRTAA